MTPARPGDPPRPDPNGHSALALVRRASPALRPLRTVHALPSRHAAGATWRLVAEQQQLGWTTMPLLTSFGVEAAPPTITRRSRSLPGLGTASLTRHARDRHAMHTRRTMSSPTASDFPLRLDGGRRGLARSACPRWFYKGPADPGPRRALVVPSFPIRREERGRRLYLVGADAYRADWHGRATRSPSRFERKNTSPGDPISAPAAPSPSWCRSRLRSVPAGAPRRAGRCFRVPIRPVGPRCAQPSNIEPTNSSSRPPGSGRPAGTSSGLQPDLREESVGRRET